MFSLKSGLTYDLLGLVTGLDSSSIKRHLDVGLKVLEKALKKNNYIPKRSFRDVEEFEKYFDKEEEIIIDATEQRINRPKKKIRKRNIQVKKMSYTKINVNSK
ncbi:MAG: hypothetical protein KatS3mg068_2109 [Candidatus Sericytochromatia bacterium]|nr:MAG: hypothetical protein KatS3mg068_2109 [Candidatus Sericytochromatia bacterium]